MTSNLRLPTYDLRLIKMNKSTRIGLLGGFGATFYIALLYKTNSNLLIIGYERWTLLIFFVLMIYGALQHRQTNLAVNSLADLANTSVDTDNDFASFGELLQLTFKIYALGFFIKFIFIYFLFNYYDPSLVEMVKEESIRIFWDNLDRNSDTAEILQQKLNNYKKGNFGPQLTDFLGIAMELVVGFSMAFGISIFLKRERPEY